MQSKQLEYSLARKLMLPLFGLIIILTHFSISGRRRLPLWDYEGFSFFDLTLYLVGITSIVFWFYQLYKDDRIVFGENEFRSRKKNDVVPYSVVSYLVSSGRLYEIQTKRGNYFIANGMISNAQEMERFMTNDLGFKLVRKSKIGVVLLYCGFILLFMISVFIDSKFALSQRRSNHLPLKRIETAQIEGTLVLHASVVLEEQEDGSTKRTYVFLHGGLKEYPGILFDYHSSGLGDEIMDVEALAAKKKN